MLSVYLITSYQPWHRPNVTQTPRPSISSYITQSNKNAAIRLPQDRNNDSMSSPAPPKQSSTSPWIILAITSGTFAALNGVFAKLYVPPHCYTDTVISGDIKMPMNPGISREPSRRCVTQTPGPGTTNPATQPWNTWNSRLIWQSWNTEQQITTQHHSQHPSPTFSEWSLRLLSRCLFGVYVNHVHLNPMLSYPYNTQHPIPQYNN